MSSPINQKQPWWSSSFSLHRSGGWRSQYDRVLRWRDRLHALNLDTLYETPQTLDDVMAFFVNCLSLRDWLRHASGLAEREIVQLFRGSAELRLCRDIANGAKHFSLDSKMQSIGGFVIGRQYKANLFVVFRDNEGSEDIRDLLDIADSCVDAVEHFLQIKSLL